MLATLGLSRAAFCQSTPSLTPTPTPTATATPTSTPTPTCDQTARFPRPFPLGVSGGNARDFIAYNGTRFCYGGTLGSLVEDSSSKTYILSTNRVLALTNKAAPGAKIVQPGLQDSACRTSRGNVIAKLTEFAEIDFAHSAENTVDAAIAEVEPYKVTAGIINIGGFSDQAASPTVGMSVQQMGEASCQTLGVITAVNVNVTANYSHKLPPKAKLANFTGQIQINSSNSTPFAAAGDIGSLVVTAPTGGSCPQPVGLLFAVGTVSGNGVGFATPVNDVLDVLDALHPNKVKALHFVNSCPAGLVAPMAANTDGFIAEAIRAATDTRDRHIDELMSISGAVGTGIGIGDARDQIAIIVYVERLTSDQRAAAPTEIEGTPVVLRKTGEIAAY